MSQTSFTSDGRFEMVAKRVQQSGARLNLDLSLLTIHVENHFGSSSNEGGVACASSASASTHK